MACRICDGTGWVCENHPRRAWIALSKRADACGCALEGMPCFCNLTALLGKVPVPQAVSLPADKKAAL